MSMYEITMCQNKAHAGPGLPLPPEHCHINKDGKDYRFSSKLAARDAIKSWAARERLVTWAQLGGAADLGSQCHYQKQSAGGQWRCVKDMNHKGKHEPSVTKSVHPTGTIKDA